MGSYSKIVTYVFCDCCTTGAQPGASELSIRRLLRIQRPRPEIGRLQIDALLSTRICETIYCVLEGSSEDGPGRKVVQQTIVSGRIEYGNKELDMATVYTVVYVARVLPLIDRFN